MTASLPVCLRVAHYGTWPRTETSPRSRPARLRGLTCERLQVDEIWSVVYAKAKNVPTAKAAPEVAGDVWTWTAIDADTKLIPSFFVGGRDAYAPTCSCATWLSA